MAWTDRGGSSTVGIHWAIAATGEKVNHHQESSYTVIGGSKPGYITMYDLFTDKFTDSG